MINPQDKALETIRRLLKLGTSSNEHEAALALQKAADIARRHSIDLGCVRAEEDRARVAEHTFQSRVLFDVVEKAATSLCMAIFRVRCLFDMRSATYVGMEHNVVAAVAAHAFVIEQCGRDLKAFKRGRWRRARQRTPEGAAHQFCLGWAFAVKHRYQADLAVAEPESQIEDSKTAIILRSQDREVADYMEQHHGDCPVEKNKRRFKRNDDAVLAGMRAGREVRIGRQIETSGQMTLAERSAV